MFLDVLRGRLDRKEITYGQLGKATGKSRAFWHMVLAGDRKLPQNVAMIEAACDLLRLSPRDFPEYRERVIIEAVRGDPKFCEAAFDLWLAGDSREHTTEGSAEEVSGGAA